MFLFISNRIKNLLVLYKKNRKESKAKPNKKEKQEKTT